jgi:hypothetical protein
VVRRLVQLFRLQAPRGWGTTEASDTLGVSGGGRTVREILLLAFPSRAGGRGASGAVMCGERVVVIRDDWVVLGSVRTFPLRYNLRASLSICTSTSSWSLVSRPWPTKEGSTRNPSS